MVSVLFVDQSSLMYVLILDNDCLACMVVFEASVVSWGDEYPYVRLVHRFTSCYCHNVQDNGFSLVKHMTSNMGF